MVQATINGRRAAFASGSTLLDAIRSLGIDLPALCHDERLRPIGACRLCLVEVRGRPHAVAACTTPLTEDADVTTCSPPLEALRRGFLELLAERVSAEALRTLPEKPLHRAMAQYEVEPRGASEGQSRPEPDDSHPYIHVDMSQCILCARCVRICADVQGQFVWHILGRGLESRVVPDRGATLGGSSCVGCGACVDTCPTGALVDKSRLHRGEAQRWTRTTCAYCGVGCELDVGTRENTIVQIRPTLQAPVNRGHACIKGRYAFDFVTAPDRVSRPLIRNSSGWREATWQEALGHSAAELHRIVTRHGPDAVGILGSARATNEENYLAQKFARTVIGTHNVDCCARVCHAPTAAAMKAMLGAGAATNAFDDIEHAKLFFLVGCNPTEAHPVVGARIRQQVLKGARLIIIDPRNTELTRQAQVAPHCDVHLALRPGTNVPLLNAMAHVVVSEGLVDLAFATARIEGLEEFRRFITAWPPERAAAICGVEAEEIRRAARLYAACAPAMCFHGLGVTEHVQGSQGVMCLVNLALLTGNLGKRGAGVNPLRGQNNVQGAAHMGCDPSVLTGSVGIEAGRPSFEDLWQTRLPVRRGLNLLEMMDAAATGKLKALWIMGYDIYLTLPDVNTVGAALSRLELLIVQDFLLNETAGTFAHVFFPAATAFEKDGTFMNSERRVQRVRRAILPPGEARPDWEIICDLARAMGAGAGFNYASTEQVWDEIRRLWPAGAGMSYARLEQGGLQWPCPAEDHPGTAVLHNATFGCGSRAALRTIDYVPSPERVDSGYPLLLTTGRSLYQFNAGTMTRRTPNETLLPTDVLEVSARDVLLYGLEDGETVRLISRYGEVRIPMRVSTRVTPGEVFATFHDPRSFLNRVTGRGRDEITLAPEYKVTAVRIEPDRP